MSTRPDDVDSDDLDDVNVNTRPDDVDNDDVNDVVIKHLEEQRNNLSYAMNVLSRQFHQHQCEFSSRNIGDHGGWCAKGGNHVTDTKLARALATLFQGATVASFGDGTGRYKALIDATGNVTLYDSFDGAPFCENRTNGLVKYLDLSIPVYGLKLYDWVLSLEVAEHIPNKYEHIYLDNVVRHAAKGIVLSWALPKQPGHGHVNGQPLDYVMKQLSKRGFYQDLETSYTLQNASRVWWLKQNTYVYRRKYKDAIIIMV